MTRQRFTPLDDNTFSFEFTSFLDAQAFKSLDKFEYDGDVYKILSRQEWPEGVVAPYLHAFRGKVRKVTR